MAENQSEPPKKQKSVVNATGSMNMGKSNTRSGGRSQKAKPSDRSGEPKKAPKKVIAQSSGAIGVDQKKRKTPKKGTNIKSKNNVTHANKPRTIRSTPPNSRSSVAGDASRKQDSTNRLVFGRVTFSPAATDATPLKEKSTHEVQAPKLGKEPTVKVLAPSAEDMKLRGVPSDDEDSAGANNITPAEEVSSQKAAPATVAPATQTVDEIASQLEHTVTSFYQQLSAWLAGQVDKNPQEFAKLEQYLHPRFEKVNPLGFASDKTGFPHKYHEWGSRADENPPYSMTIRNFRVMSEPVGRGVSLVTFDGVYTRPQQVEAVTKASVVLTNDLDETKYLLLHVHETWGMRYQESSASKLRTVELALNKEKARRAVAENKCEVAIEAWKIEKKIAHDAFYAANAAQKGIATRGYSSASSSSESSDDDSSEETDGSNFFTAQEITRIRIDRKTPQKTDKRSAADRNSKVAQTRLGRTSFLAQDVARKIISKLGEDQTGKVSLEKLMNDISVSREQDPEKNSALVHVKNDFGGASQFMATGPLRRLFKVGKSGDVSMTSKARKDPEFVKLCLESI